uniref:CUB domain-containing protein n=1 Tax=Takifugu rubripes TaxID=31033 RepID=A0A674N4D4_TAKRU
MCFVDLEKAYDQVPRSILWGALREYGVEGPLIRAAQSLNQRSRSLVRIAGLPFVTGSVHSSSSSSSSIMGSRYSRSHRSSVLSHFLFQVRDGSTETDPLIGKYCGSVLPAPVRSSSNFLWIRFKSDSSVSRAGFRAVHSWYCLPVSLSVCLSVCLSQMVNRGIRGLNATHLVFIYVSIACGGTFSGTGHLCSPYHPNAYPHNKNCEWVISQPEGYVVTLNFLSFDVEGGSCSYDFVEVRDGSMSSSPLLGTYCGVEIPPRLQSTQRSMYVRFTTDSSVSNHGFEAAYGCGDTLTSPSGTITSPGHPSIYPHGANCTWYITVSPGNLVQLVFESFNLEYHTNCNFDYVEVYDNGTTSPLIGKFCGSDRPPAIVSHSNRLWVKFHSDSAITYEGILTANRFYVPAFLCGLILTNSCCDANALMCALIYHECNKLLSASRACHDNVPSHLYLEGCGGTLTTASGGFSSPNYPLPYHPNAECYWTIRTSQGNQLLLSFSDFHLESSASCSYDYLAVSSGHHAVLGRLCGSQQPSTINSTGNQLYIKLRTDSSVAAGGFLASYSTGDLKQETHHHVQEGKDVLTIIICRCSYESKSQCSNVLVSGRYRGVVESLNFPRNYPASAQCSWTIQATTGNTINYTFTAFQLEGPASSSPLIGTFCGSQPPLPTSPQAPPSPWSSGPIPLCPSRGCGAELLGPSGSFNSPGYPDRYPENRECIWSISTAAGSSITLSIHEFDVEYHQDCNYDVLEGTVYGGPDLLAPQLAKLCTTTSSPLQVSSTGNHMTIRFKSDAYVSGRGFNASWAEVQGGRCPQVQT